MTRRCACIAHIIDQPESIGTVTLLPWHKVLAGIAGRNTTSTFSVKEARQWAQLKDIIHNVRHIHNGNAEEKLCSAE